MCCGRTILGVDAMQAGVGTHDSAQVTRRHCSINRRHAAVRSDVRGVPARLWPLASFGQLPEARA
jgi:hypothetical protein